MSTFGFGDGEQLECRVYPHTKTVSVVLSKQSDTFGVLLFELVGVLNPDSGAESRPIAIEIVDGDGNLIDSTADPSPLTITL